MIKHHHFIGRFEVAKPPLGSEKAYLEDWMANLIEGQGMNILSGPHVASRHGRQPRAHGRRHHRNLARCRPHLGRDVSGLGTARFLHLRHARQGHNIEGDQSMGRGQECLPRARSRKGA